VASAPVTFFKAFFFLEITPGPDMMLVLARRIGQGRRITLLTPWGRSSFPSRCLDFSTPAVSIGLSRGRERRETFYPMTAKRFAVSTFRAQKVEHGT
jgi:hypothetical protein